MLKVSNLSISFPSENQDNTVVKQLSFELKTNQILGIVGESGSGKSITSLALLGLLPTSAKVSGDIVFQGKSLPSLTESEWQEIRGNQISMIFQEPMSSLNPTLTCGRQVAEVLQRHTKLSKSEIKREVIALFEKVKLPRAENIYTSYPHQISGGQKQRVMIAMALACKPALLIADEPTTALDVTVQKEIILLLKSLQKETSMSILFISHDLSLVSELADQVMVMYKGSMVEKGSVKQVFLQPKENYTQALIFSKPGLDKRLQKLPTVEDFVQGTYKEALVLPEMRQTYHKELYSKAPLLRIENLNKAYVSKGSWLRKGTVVQAVQEVSFNLYEGETLGLVGESGCGKTTLGRTLLGLEKSDSGAIFYRGKDITQAGAKTLQQLRKDIQIIFQDPFSSLNPRLTVGQAILEPMTVHGILTDKKARKAHVLALLEKVGLDASYYNRYPHEFSGGQRQRIGIARTLAVQPKIVICDESVSALDVSVQAQVLNLLNALKTEFNFTYVFISHDLSVVKHMADQLLVMNAGKIEEIGEADQVYTAPKKTYTQRLIDSIPKGI